MAKKQAEEENEGSFTGPGTGFMNSVRNYVLNHNGLASSDNREEIAAANVDSSSGTAHNYAKGGVVKDDDAPVNYDPMMPHMDEGGVVGNDFDVDSGDSDTIKGIPPPVQHNPIDIASAVPPAAQPMAMPKPPPVATSRPMPGMPPGVTPDQLQSYLGNQRAQINKYSPDQQFNQEQAMLKARTGLGGSLANAGATFADAIMQGVAGKGNPGFAKAQQDQATQIAGEASGAQERARKGSLEQVEANQKIDAQDPNSTISKVHQQAYGPIFAKMGYSQKSIMSMPASQLQTLADLAVRYTDAQTQLELKKAMLQVQTLTAQATAQNQRAERTQAETKLKAEHPILSALGKLGDSGASGAVGGTTGPLGQTTVKNGATYEWSPISGKYHRKGA